MIIGLDPGRYKIGVACTDGDTLLFSAIVPKAEEDVLCSAIAENKFEKLSLWVKEGSTESIDKNEKPEGIMLGNGTSHPELEKKIREASDTALYIVNEYGTTLEGRKLYWRLNPPEGLWKIIPTSLRVPPRDIDDLAAYAIAIAGMKEVKGNL